MRTSAEQAQEGKFVVGFDFGTTFCSVAFAHSISPDQVKLVHTWPNNPTGTAEDVPTEVQYANPETREHSWGYSIPKGHRQVAEPLKWFKLLLQEDPTDFSKSTGARSVKRNRAAKSRDQTRALSNLGGIATSPAVKTSTQLRQLGLQPADVVEDFLSSARKIVHESMESTYHRAFVKDSNVEYVLTIPAIWSDSAKALMVNAAQKAGYGTHRVDFHLVSEPEAAAAHTLKVIQPNGFKEDDTFIICDAGGGTVDLISYKVRSLNPLRVDELVSGTGDLCGSVYLDAGFRAYMERRVGKATLDKMKFLARSTMNKSWEGLKCSFGPRPDNGYEDDFDIHVPGLEDNEKLGIQEGFHSMAREDIEKIFDPVVSRVIDLVKGQVDKVEKAGHSVSAIILVGGFGSSAYLFHRLKAERFSRKPGNVQVIQPVNARTAIARGAVVRGLDGSIVKEKRARRFYGVTASTPDFPAIAAHMMYFDFVDGIWRVPGGFSWYVKKGDVLRQDASTAIGFSKRVPVKPANLEIELSIMATEQDDAPDFDWQADSEASEVCKLNADFSSIVDDLPKVDHACTHCEGYYTINFSIDLTIQDDVLKFELVHNGKKYGEVKTKYQ